MAVYETHTGLTLETYREGKEYVVRLMAINEPTRAKYLYRGLNQVEQQRVYREIKAHFEKRAKDEITSG